MEKKTTKKVEVVKESAERKAYKAFLADYKVKSPVKYEAKKEVLEAKLEAIK